ncbi:MAG: hypothetical protein ABMB14_21100 [Myxococcota bacterium]
MRSISLVLWMALLGGACKNEDGVQGDDDDGIAGDDDDTDPTGTTQAPTAIPSGIGIGKISLYQGVEAILMAGGVVPAARQAPVVIGRDALIRVFVRPDDTFTARSITGVLTVTTDGVPDVVVESTVDVSAESVDDKLRTTINFHLTGDQIAASTEFSIELREADDAGPGGGDLAATSWSSEVSMDGGLPTGATDDVTVVVVPVVYQADGSNRMPDTSQAQLDAWRDAMYRIYPASSITIEVGDPLPYDSAVTAVNPLQWQKLLGEISSLRGDADVKPNTYYYGMFVPDDSFFSYCASGCIAGLSSPGISLTNTSLRSSIGLGYPDVAADTMVHEIGHAHGRFHADCGGAAGIDPKYPYPDALIGTWGYDLLNDEMKDPTVYTDIMGYCPDIWISNYNYFALWERISTLAAQPSARIGQRQVTQLVTDGTVTERAGTVRVTDPSDGGRKVTVDLFDGAGTPQGPAPGWWFGYDHLAGGQVWLDQRIPDDWSAQVHAP